MLTTRLFDIPICVLDLETTGASVEYGDRVVEIGILRIENGQVVRSVDQLVNPGRHISGGASAITGITLDMLMDKPCFGDCWQEVLELLNGAIVVGHNVGFDLSFLHGECRRLRVQFCEMLGDPSVLDTVRIARKQFGRGGNGLQRLAARLGIIPAGAHRALVDCHTTHRVLHEMLHPHGGWDVTLERANELQGIHLKLSAMPGGKTVLPTEIAEALVDGSRVRISYLDAKNRRSDREVTPKFVRRISGALTLVAHCHLKEEQRMFKIDRIISTTSVSSLFYV
ncbi:MAG: WYL domain-containing protein [Burkholderiales bacterium]|nr:WYL domain-containing protein [Phycisphaerae bacterium]